MVECRPSSPKDQARIHQFGKKVLQGILLGYELIAGGIWKWDIRTVDLEDLRKLEASDNFNYPWRINAKEVLIRQKDDEFKFPFADGTAKLAGRDYEFWKPTPRREPTVRSENLSRELQSESEESRPANRLTLLECRFEQTFVRFLESIHKVHSIERKTSKGIDTHFRKWAPSGQPPRLSDCLVGLGCPGKSRPPHTNQLQYKWDTLKFCERGPPQNSLRHEDCLKGQVTGIWIPQREEF